MKKKTLFLTQNLCAEKLMNTRNTKGYIGLRKGKEWSRKIIKIESKTFGKRVDRLA
jgi:hypothetical protein